MVKTTNPVTPFEISIIKNLLNRKKSDGKQTYTNQLILSIINMRRVKERKQPINPGRISDIKNINNKLGNDVDPCEDHEVENLLNEYYGNNSKQNDGPLGEEALQKILAVDPDDSSKLASEESDTLEFKVSFRKGWANEYLTTVAGFCNNDGGYFVFGVDDKTKEIKGINNKDFKSVDPKDPNQIFMNHFGTQVYFRTEISRINNKHLGIIYIRQAEKRPLIMIKNNDKRKIKQGEIYYRYVGETRLIGPSELQKIIEDRAKSFNQATLFKLLNQIQKNGPENSAVMSVKTGDVVGKSGGFIIDEKLLGKLQFIREGEFNETEGAPTLKLVGKLEGYKTEMPFDITKLYPLNYESLVARVKKQEKNIKRPEINAIIKKNNLKLNKKYASPYFYNPQDFSRYVNTGEVKGRQTYMYNNDAIQFICDEYKKSPVHD